MDVLYATKIGDRNFYNHFDDLIAVQVGLPTKTLSLRSRQTITLYKYLLHDSPRILILPNFRLAEHLHAWISSDANPKNS